MSCWLHELPCNLESIWSDWMLAVHRQVPCMPVTLGETVSLSPFKAMSWQKNASGMPANLFRMIVSLQSVGWPQVEAMPSMVDNSRLSYQDSLFEERWVDTAGAIRYWQSRPFCRGCLFGAEQGRQHRTYFGETVSFQGCWLHTGRCHTCLPTLDQFWRLSLFKERWQLQVRVPGMVDNPYWSRLSL